MGVVTIILSPLMNDLDLYNSYCVALDEGGGLDQARLITSAGPLLVIRSEIFPLEVRVLILYVVLYLSNFIILCIIIIQVCIHVIHKYKDNVRIII